MTRPSGFLHWIFPTMLGLIAFTILLSGRDLSLAFADLQQTTALPIHPAVAWVQPGVSVLLMAISVERLHQQFAAQRSPSSPVLASAFAVYWLATVAAPALFGSHPQLAHDYLYTLVIGAAAVLATVREREKVLDACRNALLIFLLASLAMAVMEPALALDSAYRQGLLPGVPRLAGLAPHAVALGMFAQTCLLCLWCRPFKRRWLNFLSWVLGVSVLFLAQSKNAWVAFFLCAATMVVVRHGARFWRRFGDPSRGDFGVAVCAVVIVAVLGATAALLFGNFEAQAAGFLETDEGVALLSLTGRDKIWAIAIDEWQSSPVFGYGPDLWDAAFRTSIGLPNATHAHNQFMDTLSRSGAVGAGALLVYASVLLVLSLRYAKATGGLSLALFIALALRSISEVPLILFGYGSELFTHLLLIVTLASAAGARRVDTAARSHRFYKVAS